MARIRTIKPEFFVSAQVADVSPTCRLLFVGMWLFCDDAGIHPASPKQLKMEVFPGDDITISDVRVMVDELIRVGLLIEYEAEADSQVRSYWQVTGWHHQKIEKKRCVYPQPNSTTPRRHVDDTSPTPLGFSALTVPETTVPETTVPSSSPNGDHDAIVSAWNETAAKHPQLSAIRKLTKARSEKLRARLRDAAFSGTFLESLKMLPIPNDERFIWQPNFDWMVANDTNVYALTEGKYSRAGVSKPRRTVAEIMGLKK